MTAFTFPQAGERRNPSGAVVPDFQLGTVLLLAANWLAIATEILGPTDNRGEASGHWLDVWRCLAPECQALIRSCAAETDLDLPPGAD